MRLLEGTIPSSCDIALFGDTHWGNLQMSDSGFFQTCEWIMAERNRRFVFMGDAIEAITTDDKRYQDDTTVDPIPMRQLSTFVDICQPIRKRGLAWLSGNHEFKLQRFGDIGEEMADRLEIPYGGCAAKLLLRDKRGPIAKVYLAHPSRFTIRSNAKDFEQRRANMAASVKRFLVDKAGDCVVMGFGHTHKLLVVDPSPKLVIFDEGGKLKQDYLIGDNSMPHYIDPDRRWYANTGSYLRTMVLDHDGYAERAGYDPVELGFAVVEIRDRKVTAVKRMVVD
jgi:UDP-2,3-diacylglucosamine pyrophosphatase LpxH